LALAAPAVGLRTFTPDARILPQASPVRAGYDTMAGQFGPGAAAPIEVVLVSRGPLDAAGVRSVLALRARLAVLPHVTRVDPAPAMLRAALPHQPTAPGAAVVPAPLAALAADTTATVGHFVSNDRRTVVLEVI